ncbi:MAG TPA: hypothetical protein VGO53_10155 [Steroidobacteraceae bacterium]|jgi:hypothetical protein|nr:hypothetical protein [Steroidobacteraceae bacterium]
MKRAFLFGVVVAALAAGCATQPQTADARLASESAKAAALKAQCPQDTGSRIKRQPGDEPCLQPGRAYSHEDLERTGANTPGEALRRLDPRL